MARGEEKLATQVGSKGYFGEVTLEAEPSDTGGEVSVLFDDAKAKRWRSGAQFGIYYILEHIAKRQFFPKGGRVFVRHIGGHVVDTSEALIAYLSANALLNALGIATAKRPWFDEATGNVSFPK